MCLRRTLLTALIAATVVLTSCTTVQVDGEGNVVDGSNVEGPDAQVGDCYNQDPGQRGETVGIDVDEVPCDEPHDNEVYALFDLSDEEFPGEDATVVQSYQGCLDRFAEFVGLVPEKSILEVGVFYPMQKSWEGGRREVVCSVADPAGPVTGTLEGQGEGYRLAVQGDCIDEYWLVVDCTSEHYAEVYLWTDLEGEAFPGLTAVTKEIEVLCEQAFADFVGSDWESSALDYAGRGPDEITWNLSNKRVACAVVDPEGPLTGSVQGSGR